MRMSFASDNFSGVHPKVFEALQNVNSGHAEAYGGDFWTKRLEELFKHIFGSSAEGFVVQNGTAANVIAAKHVLSSWQAILCPDTAHIWTSECGAISAASGVNLIPLASKNGKLEIETIRPFLHYRGNPHHVQPAAISITQSTEMGTIYTIDELKAISQFARKHQLLLLMDGARLSNAAAALNVSFKSLTTDIGVDILSLGGTKNGLMGADAVIFLNPSLAKNFEFLRKQSLHLTSKMRFLSAQLLALFEGDLWLQNARHANAMAKLLEEKLRAHFPQIRILYPVEANTIFAKIPLHILKKLQEKYFFWIWDEEESIARFMTTWDTKPELIDGFIAYLQTIFVP